MPARYRGPWWQRLAPGWPHRYAAGDADRIAQSQLSEPIAKGGVDAVAGIGQDAVLGCSLIDQVLDLLQRVAVDDLSGAGGRLGRVQSQ